MSTLRETLAEHPPQETSYDAGWIEGCWCGWERPPRISNEEGWAAYFAHLEAVVLAWVGARLTGARGDVSRAIERAAWTSQLRTQDGLPGISRADTALTALRDALGVPVAPNSASVDVDPTPTLAAGFDRSNDIDGIPCAACPFLGCDSCEAEATRRANGEAK